MMKSTHYSPPQHLETTERSPENLPKSAVRSKGWSQG
uniref:Uncharacterized protein n=1 Tax=Arundo donax TaxID=35708 RepID=A0A0A9EIJ7_ARUDO